MFGKNFRDATDNPPALRISEVEDYATLLTVIGDNPPARDGLPGTRRWKLNTSGFFTVKSLYAKLLNTIDVLLHKSMNLYNSCALYGIGIESQNHLFLHCKIAYKMWSSMISGTNWVWVMSGSMKILAEIWKQHIFSSFDDQVIEPTQIDKTGNMFTTPLISISNNFVLNTKNLPTVKRPKSPEKKKVQTQFYYLALPAPSKTVDVPEDSVVHIDAEDADNSLAAVEYVEDLYKVYKSAESSSRVRDICVHSGYMDLQKEINERMRMNLVDGLIKVQDRFQLLPENLYLTIHIVDRYLAINRVVRKKELNLIGITAMLIASKYEENAAIKVDKLGGTYKRKQILAMERSILGKLEWTLTVPTAYHFLVRFIKASLADQEMENMVFFLAELGLMQYAMIEYSQSMLEASAVYAAQCTLKKTPQWSKTLEHYTGFSECQLIECAKLLVSFHSEAPEHELRAVYNRYSTCTHNIVALQPPAQQLLID
ncbi:G2/mitotic-specific cyclin S13-7-like [Papaver somniferum]|uniref:G2/mitotic-specific cyclin S13-7-like n=1 Tax=Papaver somniferum TaxID=3469 RepID=UPI000E6FE512|nr:G2/mitotic-specific cyclin S13-7-like [Papaver somniferum]